MSSLVNKVKEAVSGDKHSAPEGTHGHHNNRAANAADPRIDSDRDNRAAHNTTLGGTTGTHNTHNTTLGGTTGTHNTHNTTLGGTTGTHNTHTTGPASKTDGPHKSDLLNKADPRVDSDRDHSRNMGANPHGTATTGSSGLGSSTHGTTGTSGLGSSTYDNTTLGSSTHGTTGTHNTRSGGLPEGATGPHSSRAANAADPRVDSDLDSGRNRGIGGNTLGGNTHSTTHGTTGGLHSSTGTTGGLHSSTGTTGGLHSSTGTTGGLHSSTGTHNTLGGNTHSTTHGTTHGTTGGLTQGTNTAGLSHGTTSTGPAPNTAGPHKSDMLNKMDPRVDSNLDGSKTTGGNKTFSQSETLKHKDPTDAAQVPPSVLQKHIGAPQLEHDHHDHEHGKRHSVSHQEQHRGL